METAILKAAIAVLTISLTGCGNAKDESAVNQTETTSLTTQEIKIETETSAISAAETLTEAFTAPETQTNATETTENENIVKKSFSNYTIAIDAGHQSHGNSAQEPIGPGASETKAKVTGGTSGKASGLDEYELNLIISLKLKKLLEEKGYNVIMTRETNDVDISNSERAAIANSANANAFVRIHANGSDDPAVNGAMTICQTPSNPYNGYLYDESYSLAENILNSLTEETGAYREKIWETDTMSGINWATVPTTIVEVGYMSNREEDLKLANEEYQDKVALGIMKGIEKYLQVNE
ncbi:MAG: N-acetylmuramoyl-L-alanine amidase [Firmicutes bacterium]|nr:N-acetylmuramoyl-L-alanine amidase [Bacillota bacterium]